jgi:hypothetical protein
VGKRQRGEPTRKQKQIIHILEHQLIGKGLLDDKGYHLILMGWFGKKSSRDLTHEEASFLIDQLVKMGGVITPSPGREGSKGLISFRRFHEESSLEGLRKEVLQIAKERYGKDFERPLAALCRHLNIEDYRSVDVRHGKALKDALLRLQSEGPYGRGKK